MSCSGNHAESVDLIGSTLRTQLRVTEPDVFLKLEQEFLDADTEGTGVVSETTLREVGGRPISCDSAFATDPQHLFYLRAFGK